MRTDRERFEQLVVQLTSAIKQAGDLSSTSTSQTRQQDKCTSAQMLEMIEELNQIGKNYLDLSIGSPEMILIVDQATGIIAHANERLSTALGYEPDQLHGRSMFELYHPTSAKQIKTYLHDLKRFHNIIKDDVLMYRKDGTHISTNLTIASFNNDRELILSHRSYWPNGLRLPTLPASMPGVPNEAMATSHLQASIERFAHDVEVVLNTFPDLYFWMENDGTIRRFYAATQTYVPPEQFLNRRMQDVLPPPASGLISNAITQAIETNNYSDVTYQLTVNNVECWYQARIVAVPDANYVVACVRDITTQIKAEQEKTKLQSQLLHAQKLECLGVLAGGIAHDFNNLLTSILGYSDLALSITSPDATAHFYINEVVKGARRAGELTQQMLAYSGKGRFLLQPVSLTEMIDDMARLLEISISKRCVLQFHLMRDMPACEADIAQLRQIIMNLVINASDAIGDHSGVISVSTGVMYCDRTYLSSAYLDEQLPEQHYVFMEVADSGCGMSEDTKARLFDPFFTTKFAGRGLGLSAVLGIVRGHRGVVKVYSEEGNGTTFKVLFPASEKTPVMTSIHSATGSYTSKGTVLVVDDEDAIRALSAEMFRIMGFDTLTAVDGEQAVETFRKEHERIRLVLLDMTMPHLDGEQTFREMRRIGDVPTILCSGFNEQTAINRFAGKGLAGFIQKPFRFQQLADATRKALDE